MYKHVHSELAMILATFSFVIHFLGKKARLITINLQEYPALPGLLLPPLPSILAIQGYTPISGQRTRGPIPPHATRVYLLLFPFDKSISSVFLFVFARLASLRAVIMRFQFFWAADNPVSLSATSTVDDGR